MKKSISLMITFSLFFGACRRLPPTPIDCASGTVSYAAQVQPIINQNCNVSGCHGFSNAAPFQLLSHRQLDSAVIYTNLLLSIKHQSALPMPRIDPLLPDAYLLPDSLIQIIECWINQGRQNN